MTRFLRLFKIPTLAAIFKIRKKILFRCNKINLSGEEAELEDEDGIRKSALDLDPEAQAVMEMMGKTFVSKDVRAADEQDAKTKKELQQDEN